MATFAERHPLDHVGWHHGFNRRWFGCECWKQYAHEYVLAVSVGRVTLMWTFEISRSAA